jgi:hypothetical protein
VTLRAVLVLAPSGIRQSNSSFLSRFSGEDQLTPQCRRLGGPRCHSGYTGEKQIPAPRRNRTELFNSQSSSSESFGHQGLLSSPLIHSMFLKRKIYNNLRTVHDSQKQRLACRHLSTVHWYRSLSFATTLESNRYYTVRFWCPNTENSRWISSVVWVRDSWPAFVTLLSSPKLRFSKWGNAIHCSLIWLATDTPKHGCGYSPLVATRVRNYEERSLKDYISPTFRFPSYAPSRKKHSLCIKYVFHSNRVN